MAKERLIQCKHYICENNCNISSKKCRFWKEMQTCGKYEKKDNAVPVRSDNRKSKLEKARKKDLRGELL